LDFLGIGGAEVLLIIVVAILVLGPTKIVDFAKTLGQISQKVRKASMELTSSVTREVDEEERAAKSEKDKPGPGKDGKAPAGPGPR